VKLWEREMRIVRGAVDGEKVSESEFLHAISFFSDLTGIEIRANLSYVGAIPTEETRSDLSKLSAWFQKHGSRIYWSKSEESVELRTL
jgi:hypothetical protein